MSINQNVRLRAVQHQVASAALTGAAFDEIERDVILPSGCSERERDALRLYAWSFLSRFEQRRIALDRLCAKLPPDAGSGALLACAPQAARGMRGGGDRPAG